MLRRRRHRLVGEVDEDDEDPHLAAQGRAIEGAATGDAERRAERQVEDRAQVLLEL